jgi:transposase-like protein
LSTILAFLEGMPNPYALALRERAVAAYERGEGSYALLGALFRVAPRTLERWVARHRATGSVAPFAKGGGWRCPIDLAVLHAVINERPDGTAAELCRVYNRRVRRARRTTPTSFYRAMRRPGMS